MNKGFNEMKSIMEEASSITKAIENAWNRAGKPQEFSVKILELPKTSFFGFKTSKSAKVALFFNEQTAKIREEHPKQVRPLQGRPLVKPEQRGQARPMVRPERPERPAHAQQKPDHRRPSPAQRPERPDRQEGHTQPRQERQEGQAPIRQERQEGYAQPRQDRPHFRAQEDRNESRDSWTPEMVNAAQEWVKETLVLMGKPEINILPYVSNNYLKLTLDHSVANDARQEETQLKSWGNLAMESIREKTQKPLRNLRIVLESKR